MKKNDNYNLVLTTIKPMALLMPMMRKTDGHHDDSDLNHDGDGHDSDRD